MAILLTLGIIAGSIIIPSVAAWWQAQQQGQQISESVHNEFQKIKEETTAAGAETPTPQKDNTILIGIVAAIIVVIVIYIATRD
jgi:CHASE3 domain sensor protein